MPNEMFLTLYHLAQCILKSNLYKEIKENRIDDKINCFVVAISAVLKENDHSRGSTYDDCRFKIVPYAAIG